jgi:hypothetical protein
MRLLFNALIFFFSFSIFSQNPEVGDFHQGGVVFYIDSLGNGLILDTTYLEATYDWVTNYPMLSYWGLQWVNHSGAVEEFIGAGQFNTNNLALYGSDYAANLCYNNSSGGFTDWFLPSHDELWQVMINLELIDSAISVHGGDYINEGGHWSSTQALNQSYANIAYPYSTNLSGEPMGPFQTIKSKNTGALVRAVRCINNDCDFAGSPTFGCNDPIAENYDPSVGVNDNSCIYILGCTDTSSCNYNSSATMDDSTCDYSCIGCTDSMALNYLGDMITIEDGSCLYCIDEYQIITVDYDTLIDNSVFFSIDSLDITFEEVVGGPFNQGFCIPDGCYTLTMLASCNITDTWYGNTFTIGNFSYTLETPFASVDFYLGDYDCDGNCISVGLPCDDEDMNTLDDIIQEDCECVGTSQVIVDELDTLSVLIYPNPAYDQLIIELGDLTGIRSTIKLYDSSSKLLFEKQSNSTIKIDVSSYAKGLYTLKISNSDKVLRSQVLLE